METRHNILPSRNSKLNNIRFTIRNMRNFIKYNNEYLHSLDLLNSTTLSAVDYFNNTLFLVNGRKFLSQVMLLIDQWLLNRNKSYRRPSIEHNALDLFEKHFPKLRKYKLHDKPTPSKEEIFDADKEQIKRYQSYKSIKWKFINFKILDEVLDFVKHGSGVPTVKFTPLSFDEAINSLPSEASACYPYFTRKGNAKTRHDCKLFYIQLKRLLEKSHFTEAFISLMNMPTVIFHRFTPSLTKVKKRIDLTYKIRQIYGVPLIIATIESMLFREPIEYFSKRNYFFSYGNTRTITSQSIASLRIKAEFAKRRILCGDFSKVDSTITPESIFFVFDILRDLIELNPLQEKLFDLLYHYHMVTPISWASEKITFSFGANKTGSLLTSFINSITSLIAIVYYLKTHKRPVPRKDELFILGDDFVMLIDDISQVDTIVKFYNLFNLTLHPLGTKTTVSDYNTPITYLGFEWDLNNYPTNDFYWYTAKICFPERYVKVSGLNRIISRAASILFQIHLGHLVFEKVFTQEPIIRQALQNYNDVVIDYFDQSGRLYYVKLPLSTLYAFKWRSF